MDNEYAIRYKLIWLRNKFYDLGADDAVKMVCNLADDLGIDNLINDESCEEDE